jgi:protein-S-isoprenylcysteine O-methyltransferase Ste14
MTISEPNLHPLSPAGMTEPPAPSWFLRIWLALPDWVFRLAGASLFLAFIIPRVPSYFSDFWSSGVWYQPSGSRRILIPWGRLLIDTTYLLIAVGFIFRMPPRSRAARLREILLPLIAASWPFFPWIIKSIGQLTDAGWSPYYNTFMMDPAHWTMPRFLFASGLIIFGNALDVWGYVILVRSFSIVAEARALKVNGPYHIVRHPIYLGQMIAQAGVWLCYADPHLVWLGFWLAFVVMQLVRSAIEDEVLEQAFGERYLAWKRKTFWFV